jgi:hypothetical protein
VRRVAPPLILLVIVFGGCGSSGETATPTACLAPTGQYLRALQDAPGQVRLGGETAISDCFSATQTAGDQAQVGQTVIEAATELNAQARQDPGAEDTVRLGYLVGAVQEGASHASGIDADLVRRLDTAARYRPGGRSFGVAFERAFGKGYAAGQAGG